MKPKVAIYYDWLNQWGGAEKVLLDLIKIYPEAPIYTLVHDPKKTNWLPKNAKIITSFIDKLPFSKKNPFFYTPLYSVALEQFDFSKFDIIISTTSTIGHCLLTQPQTISVCYMHNINRHIYQKNYMWPISKILNHYKLTDQIYSQRPDYIFCNSQTVKDRIQNIYHRSSKIINPGVDTSFFKPPKKPSIGDYFLVVSRLVPHKKIDIAIHACHELKQKLFIVGSGRNKNKLNKLLKSLDDPHIKLLGSISDKKLLSLYQNCQTLICPQLEDFGLSPIEAQACGKPVIAYQKGGLTETVVDNQTGIFFKYQTVPSLKLAIKKFQTKNFSSTICRENSLRFSNKSFMLNFKKEIDYLWQEHQSNTI